MYMWTLEENLRNSPCWITGKYVQKEDLHKEGSEQDKVSSQYNVVNIDLGIYFVYSLAEGNEVYIFPIPFCSVFKINYYFFLLWFW